LISRQLDEILHHPAFKTLEAAWRGLHYLVGESQAGQTVKIKVIHVTKNELLKDFERAETIKDSGFDGGQEAAGSALFKKIYTEVYSSWGTDPYGALIGNFEFDHFPKDMTLLEKLAVVASIAKAPFISAPSPGMFYFSDDNFEEITDYRDASRVFSQTQYTRWRVFRDSENSKYVGLCLPRILLRDPHQLNAPFNFQESNGKKELLWGNAAFAFGASLVRAFNEKSWLGKMDGPGSDAEVGGLYFQFTEGGQDRKDHGFSLDASILPWAQDLSDSGLMPLIDESSIEKNPYFFSSQSVYQPKKYDTKQANICAHATAQLENILAISRFAIYMMCMCRDRIPFFLSRQELQNWLNRWLSQYWGHESTEEEIARHPLPDGRLDVTEVPGKPGQYRAIAFLLPVYQLKEMSVAMRIVFDIPSPAGIRS
jgi:type VI secretion system protein ImpC